MQKMEQNNLVNAYVDENGEVLQILTTEEEEFDESSNHFSNIHQNIQIKTEEDELSDNNTNNASLLFFDSEATQILVKDEKEDPGYQPLYPHIQKDVDTSNLMLKEIDGESEEEISGLDLLKAAASGNVQDVSVCSICKRVFLYSEELTEHMASEHPDEVDSTEEGPVLLLDHQKKRKKDPTPARFRRATYKCKKCQHTFYDKKKFSMHNCEQRNAECGFCSKQFNSNGALKQHLRIHTGERPYSCEICGKSFTQRATLTTHMRMHKGDRPYQCEHCAKTFYSQSNLKTHKTMHTGEKPFECVECGKRFRLHGDLKKHSVTHTGIRAYRCDLCYGSYKQISQLHFHKRTVHKRDVEAEFLRNNEEVDYVGDFGIDWLKCQFCKQDFPNETELATHVNNEHSTFRPDVLAQTFEAAFNF